MTARDHVRFGARRLARARAAIDATPAPRLGEMLQLAREKKGVDRFRAERDTKIRLKYLAALEDSEFDQLPAPVYTKGFLRNYAMYLGLDPDDVLIRWREEMHAQRNAQRLVVAPPPQPIAAPRRGPTISAGMLMAGLLTLVVLGFMGYIAVQLLRYAEAPEVTVTSPASLVSVVDADKIELAGTSGPGSVITVHAPGGQLLTTTADENGRWSREVPVAKGRNDFSIEAMDPVTRRNSERVEVIVTVPLAEASPGVSPSPSAPFAIRLSLSSPSEETVIDDGTLIVSGTTSGSRITIEAQPLDAPGGGATPAPGSPAPASPDPDSSPITPRDVTVPSSGVFSEQLELTPGRWQIAVTAYSSGLEPVSITRTVTVEQADELVLVVEVGRRDSWVRVFADGRAVRGYRSRILRAGETHTFTASEEIWMRTGNAGMLSITQNGQELGRLGGAGEIGNWIFHPGEAPEKTTEAR